MIGALIAKIGLGGVNAAIREAARWHERRENAQTQREKTEAELQIAYWDAVVRAQENDPLAPFVRAAIAIPVILITWKLFVWDKVLGGLTGGSTTLSPFYERWMFLVAGFYFLFELKERWRR